MQTKFLIPLALTGALTFSAAPAAAQQAGGRSFPHWESSGPCRQADRQHAHHDTGFGCGGDGSAYGDSEWALYNNRSWDADSYNDWWHDRPDRAFPRWVQEQRARGTCDLGRVWWSGAGWHC